jgi:hypothetical protein
VGQEVCAIDVVGLVIYACQARRGGRGRAGFAREALKALLFVVGDVDDDKGGRVALGRVENAGDLGEAGAAGAADVDCSGVSISAMGASQATYLR